MVGGTNPKTGVYSHYKDITINGKVANRNVFYPKDEEALTLNEYFEASKITVLFNDAPNSIKEFSSITYEGSQAKTGGFGTVLNQTQPDGSMFSNMSIGTGVTDIEETTAESMLSDFSVQGIGNLIIPSQTFTFDPLISVEITNEDDNE